MSLSDKEFINQIEKLELDPSEFTHEGHLRLAWLYLSSFASEKAVTKTCETIKAYATSLGASDKFHMTITSALVEIINKRMNREESWKEFISNNLDLQDNSWGVLLHYYSEELISSDESKKTYIKPEKKL